MPPFTPYNLGMNCKIFYIKVYQKGIFNCNFKWHFSRNMFQKNICPCFPKHLITYSKQAEAYNTALLQEL